MVRTDRAGMSLWYVVDTNAHCGFGEILAWGPVQDSKQNGEHDEGPCVVLSR